jgi:two-component system NtrC family sensor kinase
MSKDVLKHIFDPFFSTKKGSGTGLGLSITYGIVKKLGGTIDVKSKPASGTTFTIFLPKKGIQAEDVRDGNMESALGG